MDSNANPFSLKESERKLTHDALRKCRGSKTKAAELLGITRRTLHRRIKLDPTLNLIDRG